MVMVKRSSRSPSRASAHHSLSLRSSNTDQPAGRRSSEGAIRRMSRDSSLASVSWEAASPADLALCTAAELAGSVLAHAVWCMSEEDEGPFAPTIAYDGADGRKFLMFDDEDYDAA